MLNGWLGSRSIGMSPSRRTFSHLSRLFCDLNELNVLKVCNHKSF